MNMKPILTTTEESPRHLHYMNRKHFCKSEQSIAQQYRYMNDK